jgi:ABC-type phosphate transport system auxiliary subunit
MADEKTPEQLEAERLEAERVAALEPVNVIKIGEKQYSTEQFDELKGELEKDFTSEQISKMDDETIGVLVSKMASLKEASNSWNNRNQLLARDKEKLQTDQALFSEEKTKFESRKTELESAETVLVENLRIIEAKIAEQEAILKLDPYSEDDLVKQQTIVSQKEFAKRELENWKNLKTENQGKLETTKNTVVTTAEVLERINLYNDLQKDYPELATSKPVGLILFEYNNDKEVDEMELIKAARISEIANEYIASGTKKSIGDFYKLKSVTLPPLPKVNFAQPENIKEITLAEQIKSAIRKQKYDNPPPNGGAPNASPKDEKDIAKRTGWYR